MKSLNHRSVQILLGIGVLITVLSVQTPWLLIDLGRFEIFSFSLFDIYRALISSTIEVQVLPLLVVIAISAFLLAILAGVLSLTKRQLATLFGAMNLATGIVWILGVDSISSEVIHAIGDIGSTVPRHAISSGLGAYLVIGVGAVVLIGNYVMQER